MLYQHVPPNRPHLNRRSQSKQRGVVVIIALFIVALVATMAYVMMTRVERDTRRTSLLLRDRQAELYAQGSITWAIDQLRMNVQQAKPEQIVDKIPMKTALTDVDGFTVSSTIDDMQSRFNINNITNVDSQVDFKRLLRVVDPTLTDGQAQAILLATLDWIQPGQIQNEYSKYYMELPTPYRAAHRNMQSVSELQLVKGMTPRLYQALRPYVTALPVTTAINVQTATAPVLMLLSPAMTLEAARMLEKQRAQVMFTSVPAFMSSEIAKNHHITQEKKLTVVSQYFLLETKITIENQHVVLYTLLSRTANQGKPNVDILWQSKGIW